MTSSGNQYKNSTRDRVPLWIMTAIVLMIIGIVIYGRLQALQ